MAADQVDLSVTAGERSAIIGPNGAGKTSLFNLIAGGISPDAGTILLDGKDITRQTAPALPSPGSGARIRSRSPFEEPDRVRESCWSAPSTGSGKKRTRRCRRRADEILDQTAPAATRQCAWRVR